MIQACAKTDIGKKRKVNQDCVYACTGQIGAFPNLFILADGMGGHKAGDYASWFLTESLRCFVAKTNVREVIRVFSSSIDLANSLLLEKAESAEEFQGMGSTLVMATVDGAELTCANVGDSRLYVIHMGQIAQITVDHSYVEEMVRMGMIQRGSEEYLRQKNLITRAMGVEKRVKPDFFDYRLEDGDYVLLCSDGLSNMLEEKEIAEIVSGQKKLEDKVQRLIDRANEEGGRDNIAVILLSYRKGGGQNA